MWQHGMSLILTYSKVTLLKAHHTYSTDVMIILPRLTVGQCWLLP